MKQKPPARSNVTVLQQLLNPIARRLVGQHARESGVEAKARNFCVRSHLAAMLFAQLAHAIGFNVYDWLRLKRRSQSLGQGTISDYLQHQRNRFIHARTSSGRSFLAGHGDGFAG